MTDLLILLGSIEGGGAERVAVSLANSLPTSISNELVIIHESKIKYNVNSPYILLSGKQISGLARLCKFPLVILRYILLLRKYNPKVSLSILPEDNVVNIISSLITGVHPIISFHGMPSNKNCHIFTQILKKISIFLLKITNTSAIAVSNGVKNELVILYGVNYQKIHVIHNPIDVIQINKLSLEEVKTEIFNHKVKTIITVGRLSSVKGQWHILRVFAELRRTIQCRLVLCGEGPELEYLMNLTIDLGVKEDVVFLGWSKNPYKYVARADLFVLSSLSEALPNVLVEAMAVGCPVVAANCSEGIEEILGFDNSCGFVTNKMTGIYHVADEPLDEGELSMLYFIQKILYNPDLRESMSRRCKERAQMFDLNRGIQKYTDMIDKINNLNRNFKKN